MRPFIETVKAETLSEGEERLLRSGLATYLQILANRDSPVESEDMTQQEEYEALLPIFAKLFPNKPNPWEE